MAGLTAANLGLEFPLELVAIAAFAYWGASRSPVILAVIAIAIPAVFVAAWSIWAAPRSPRSLPRQTRVPFGLAAVALIAAGAAVAGIAFAAIAAVNAVLRAAFGQLEA